MKGLRFTQTDTGYMVYGQRYDLNVNTEKATAGVILGGLTVAALDLRSAVNKTADDNSVINDSEQQIPVFENFCDTESGIVFKWHGKSSLWEKEYTIICTPLRFQYKIKVLGSGRVDSVNYFSGDIVSNNHGSAYEFAEGFNPCVSWYNTEPHYFRASVKNSRWAVLMVPPMYCYSFRTEGLHDRLTLGVVAERGEHNFHSFSYTPVSNGWNTSGFFLSTDQDGHTAVEKEWTAPYIIGFGADDEFDSMRKYTEYYFTSGIAKTKKAAVPPRFWHGPMVCGWIEQSVKSAQEHVSILDLANERVYNDILKKCSYYGIKPAALIIDDKWQEHYATDYVNPQKFSNLRAFVDKRHAEGISTLLWFKLWDPDGWDESLCIADDKGVKRIDPSHPKFIENLDNAIHRLLSSDEGCYDCDGFKLDYAFFNPIGRGFKTYSGKYGSELLYEMMEHIYTKAKEIKPYALINCSPCHPYFAHICDQARLHDYDPLNRDNYSDLALRAKLFSIAIPNTLLDTDNAGFNTRRDAMHWLMNQPQIGVPDLYALSIREGLDMTEDDYYAIADLWKEYSARIDAMYE